MRPTFLAIFLCLLLSPLADQRAQSDEIFDQAEISFNALKSGDTDAIPQLAEMLLDERLCTTACTTLANLPNEAGRPSLREALDRAILDPSTNERSLQQLVLTLGNLRDAPSTDALVKIVESDSGSDSASTLKNLALVSLGKIANEKAIATICARLDSPEACEALFFAARQLTQEGRNEDAVRLYQRARNAQLPRKYVLMATYNEILLTEDVALFLTLLKSDDLEALRFAKTILTHRPSAKLLRAALDAARDLDAATQIAIVETVGVAGNREIVPTLLTMLESAPDALQPTILDALGKLQDARCLDAFARNLSAEAPLRQAAAAGLKRLPLEDAKVRSALEETLRGLLRAEDETLALVAAEIASERNLTNLLPEIKKWTHTAPEETALAAFRFYVSLLPPIPATLGEILKEYPEVCATHVEAMAPLCARMSDKPAALGLLQKHFAQAPLPLVEYATNMGGPAASRLLGELALRDNDALSDAATQALGKWATVDAAPVLLRLAKTHPVEKYRVRTLRGCIRIVRQLGLSPLVKKQLCHAAAACATRDEERKMIQPLLDESLRLFPERSLFDGQTLAGWEGRQDVFRVEEGAIVGGSFEKGLDRNEFLTSIEQFDNFYLRLECKILGDGGNAGVQFRSSRVLNNHEMIGYQADMTSDGAYWGCLYDESRRRRMLQMPDAQLRKAMWIPNDWNTYEIVCEGKTVRLYLNGVQMVEYLELDDSIPRMGVLGLQIHSGGPSQSYYRNIFITTRSGDDSQ
ncbi:MAG: DUF1080 domain-containing protein [Planctomycetia bacterium]|nr:DUF1080 domain-containing protein [Planctomycetia bacterium]